VPRLESSSQESGESEVGEKVVRRSPDATFYHPAQPDYPTVIAEVSYSQQQKELPVLAKSYIIDSSHAICAVVGFKIPYLPPGARGSQKLKESARPHSTRQYYILLRTCDAILRLQRLTTLPDVRPPRGRTEKANGGPSSASSNGRRMGRKR